MANANARGRRFEMRLAEDEESAMIDNLEQLMETFEREEIPPERFTEAMLEDPILLLLAQHRSFRICRREFICLIQGYRPHKPITLLGRLASHIQPCHGATKQETADMVRDFISKLLTNPIQAITMTRGGH
jgi:hypothetical protein